MIKELYKRAENKVVKVSLTKREADKLHQEITEFYSQPKYTNIPYKAIYDPKEGLSYFLPNLEIKVGKRKYTRK